MKLLNSVLTVLSVDDAHGWSGSSGPPPSPGPMPPQCLKGRSPWAIRKPEHQRPRQEPALNPAPNRNAPRRKTQRMSICPCVARAGQDEKDQKDICRSVHPPSRGHPGQEKRLGPCWPPERSTAGLPPTRVLRPCPWGRSRPPGGSHQPAGTTGGPSQSGRQVAHRHKTFSSFHWAETHVLQAAQRGLGREGDDEGSEADEAQRELHGRH